MSESCPYYCDRIPVLHATPKNWIPDIVAHGFELAKDHPERASWGKGAGEDDVIFFERFTPLGARYAISWSQSLAHGWKPNPTHDVPHGIVGAEICSCMHLDEPALRFHRKLLAQRGAEFIMDAHEEPEISRPRMAEHLGGRLEFDESYADPLSFLRKIAGDADHCVYDDEKKTHCTHIVRYGIGEVMKTLGYDTADGFTRSHSMSPIADDRNAPINELIVADPHRITNIHEIDPAELCQRFKDEPPYARDL
jgi:hypothetical protein